MKEVALLGFVSHVFATVLSKLLHNNIAVNAIVNNPERLMVENAKLTISQLMIDLPLCAESFDGYDNVVMAFDDDLTNHAVNEFVRHNFRLFVDAAQRADVKRLVVVGAKESTAFFVRSLEHYPKLDWTFIPTEGDYATATLREILFPKSHHCVVP